MSAWTGRTSPGQGAPAGAPDADDYLDGNAAAGPLSALFRGEVTGARGRCEGCGTVDVLAAARWYPHAPGLVLRCARCDGVLLRLVETPDRVCLDVRGLSFIEFGPGESG